MAKRKKYKRSSKCPEPFNTLIDIAGGIAMNAVANKMEKKYHYSKKRTINPYKVSAFKIGTGRYRSTEDIVRTGGFLGAMGSFDVESDTSSKKEKTKNAVPEDPIFNQIKYSSTINNKYAWRLNCEDGSEYGVDPCNYETRDEYNQALEKAEKTCGADEHNEDTYEKNNAVDAPPVSNTPFVLCRVSLLSNGANLYAISNDQSPKIGDKVLVSYDGTEEEAVVIAVEQHTVNFAPHENNKARIIKLI